MIRILPTLLLLACPLPAQPDWPLPTGMASVPARTYRIGVDDQEVRDLVRKLGYGERFERAINHWSSVPAHQHALDAFYIDQNEITCKQYESFLQAHPEIPAPRYWDKGKKEWVEMWLQRRVPNFWENVPVTGISYQEARRFARWIGRRLPTEFEWEAAARYSPETNDRRYFPWGSARPGHPVVRANSELAFENENRKHLSIPLMEVGSFDEGRSFLGLNDVAGNAAEMTESAWIPYPGYQPFRFNNRENRADFDQDYIVVRGGHALHPELSLTTYFRLGFPQCARTQWVGFRTAMSKVRGQDQVNWLLEDVGVTLAMQDYPLLASDRREKRRRPVLEAEDPRQFTSFVSGGLDPIKGTASKARYITLANRKTRDLRSKTSMRVASTTGPALLGILVVDHQIHEPDIAPGRYIVSWRQAHRGEVKLEDGTMKPTRLPAAIILRAIGRNGEEIRFEDHHLRVNAPKGRTRMDLDRETGRILCVMSWPDRTGRRAFEVSFGLTVSTDTASRLR